MSATALALPTGSLLQLTDHLQALFDTMEMITDPKLRAEAERDIERYLSAEVDKIDATSAYLSFCEMQQSAAKAEIERLKERISTWETRENRVRGYIQNVMQRFGKTKLEGKTSTFSLRQAPSSVIVTDEQQIPDEYKRTTVAVQVDKVAIRKAIESGREIAGADLAIGKTVLVRK